jgi:hypothetical protein
MGLDMSKRTARLSFAQRELAVNFYDAACDEPSATFEPIAKRVVPRGFGKSRSSAAFEKESRKMFNLTR